MKSNVYMLSDFAPWQVYRWRVDHEKKIDVIERFDAERDGWVVADNELLRGAFMDAQDASLSNIDPVSDARAKKLTAEGWAGLTA
jgi:hypothetical protein